ncbi:hypothetical protein FRC17_007506 [Serendipita sp. 399]|nr:hypothetical protein FRC17_007506 [Serendipita sp. 399]
MPWVLALLILTVYNNLCLLSLAQSVGDPIVLVHPAEIFACELATFSWTGGQPTYSLFYALQQPGGTIGDDRLLGTTTGNDMTFEAPDHPGKTLYFKLVDQLGQEATAWIRDRPSSTCGGMTIFDPTSTGTSDPSMTSHPRTEPTDTDPFPTLSGTDSFSYTMGDPPSTTATRFTDLPPENTGMVTQTRTSPNTSSNTAIQNPGGPSTSRRPPSPNDTRTGPVTAAPFSEANREAEVRHPISKQAKGAIFGTIFGSLGVFVSVVYWRWRVRHLRKRKPILVLPRSRKEGEEIVGEGSSNIFGEGVPSSNDSSINHTTAPTRRIAAGINEEELRSMMLLHAPASPMTQSAPPALSQQQQASQSSANLVAASPIQHTTGPIEVDSSAQMRLMASTSSATYPRVPPLVIPSTKERSSRVNLTRSSPLYREIGGASAASAEQRAAPADAATRMTTPSLYSQTSADGVAARQPSFHDTESIEPGESRYNDGHSAAPGGDEVSLYLRPSPVYETTRTTIPPVSLQQLVGRELENLLSQMTASHAGQTPPSPSSAAQQQQHQDWPIDGVTGLPMEQGAPAYEPRSQPRRLALHVPPPESSHEKGRGDAHAESSPSTASRNPVSSSSPNEEQASYSPSSSSGWPSRLQNRRGSGASNTPTGLSPRDSRRSPHSETPSAPAYTQRLVISRQDMDHLADLVALRISGHNSPNINHLTDNTNRLGSNSLPLVREDNLPPPSYT